MKYLATFLFFIISMSLSGCAKTLGIYETEYGCPQTESGECVSVENAHSAATGAIPGKDAIISEYIPDPAEEEEFLVQEVGNFDALLGEYDKCVKKKGQGHDDCQDIQNKLKGHYLSAEDRGRSKELHGVSMQERVTQLAMMSAMASGSSTTIPVRQPDTVMELHILPYRTDNGTLASERTMWVVVQEGQWTWATKENQGRSRPRLGETR